MDKKITLSTFNPSLKQKSVLCIVIALWKHKSLEVINHILHKPKSNECLVFWLRDFLSILPVKCIEFKLPSSLIKKISYLIRPIGKEILKWMEDQRQISENEQFLILSLEHICWTSTGTVDDRRSAEALINSGKLDDLLQYKLACNYCLESCAITLWENLSEGQKSRILEDININDRNEALYIVTCTIHTEMQAPVLSEVMFALDSAIRNGHKAQTKFFFEKIPAEDKKAVILFFLDEAENTKLHIFLEFGHFTEILLFLLANTDKEILQLLSSRGYRILLTMFLEWPVMSLFLEVAQYILPYIEEDDFNITLENIFYKHETTSFDYYYMILFKEFLKLKPEFLDLEKYEQFRVLQCFLDAQDKEGVSLVIKGFTLELTQEFFHFNSGAYCKLLEFPERWDFLQMFIRDCIKEVRKGHVGYRAFMSLKRLGFYNDRTESYSDLYKLIGDLIKFKGLKRSANDDASVAKRTRRGCNPEKYVDLELEIRNFDVIG